MIIDLSYPKLHSVNDGIPKHLCSLTYVTVDDTITTNLESGLNILLAKADIKHAFCLLPVHPVDRHLLAMEWNQSIYIDTCLPFGLRSAPKLFNILVNLLSWVTTQQGMTFSIHCLDDFLMFGPPDSPVCQHNLNTFTQICDELGIPLATEKLEGPSIPLTILGIILDTHRMEICLSKDKLQRIRQELSSWLQHKKTTTKRDILSLISLLQNAIKVVRSEQIFVT